MDYVINTDMCEFYGIMIGDGCISKYAQQNNVHFEVRIDGNAITDYLYYENTLKNLIYRISKRSPKIHFRKDCNGICIRFNSKDLALFFNKRLSFPIGKKGQINLPKPLLEDWEKARAIIRGIFDTDGSLYFTKNDYHKKRSYPIIEIVSISKKLLRQLSSVLVLRGFNIKIGHGGKSIKLHGKKNLKAWMSSIGTSHIDKLSKFLFWQKYGMCPTNEELPLSKRLKKLGRGSVAQPGLDGNHKFSRTKRLSYMTLIRQN